ncbi:MAG: helix-turn-helix domain-containing protein [Clostridia bacterium]|nr:helix-turn-helix domain-containing protein [Clostridia bacterium]
MNDYNFGNFVCHLREKNGLTQAEVAYRLGVTAAAVSKWENGSSKPRVEILFQLAEMLGVRPEELMAGHYIEEERLDADAIRQINERYEYLRRIDLHNETGTKIRRLGAWLIDWNLIGFVLLLVISAYMAFFEQEGASQAEILILLFLILSYPVCFILRDLIFGGRSLGKRMLKLVILSKQTGEAPKKSQLLLRNIFSFFVIEIDALIMLITGLSIGDRLAHTVVVAKKDIDLHCKPQSPQQRMEEINRYPERRSAQSASNKKTLIILLSVLGAAFIGFVVFVIFITNIMLENQKDSEEYQMAYTYLIESERFSELGLSEEDVKLVSSSTYHTKQNGKEYHETEFGFKVGVFREFYVICHDEGDGWFVCTECTEFQ